MDYFNINIDNDITYLLQEIGHNVKVNNISAKAIINNASMERTYDDKKIITHEELRRGYYVEYNNLFFIVLNEVNDKRYLTYYKGIIRRCNYDVKFVIDGKLFLFYSIIDSDKFNINENRLINTSANTISVSLPLTAITKKINEGTRFIKFNKVWIVEGMDYTSAGLVVLHCKVDSINTNTDDIENEVADKDKLTDNTIIYPFDDAGTPEEPTDPEEPEPVEDNITITITGNDTINVITNGKYTAKVYNNGVEVSDKQVRFAVSDTTLATIKSQGNNQCELVANPNFKLGEVILKAILIEDETVFAEKLVAVTGM